MYDVQEEADEDEVVPTTADTQQEEEPVDVISTQ